MGGPLDCVILVPSSHVSVLMAMSAVMVRGFAAAVSQTDAGRLLGERIAQRPSGAWQKVCPVHGVIWVTSPDDEQVTSVSAAHCLARTGSHCSQRRASALHWNAQSRTSTPPPAAQKTAVCSDWHCTKVPGAQ